MVNSFEKLEKRLANYMALILETDSLILAYENSGIPLPDIEFPDVDLEELIDLKELLDRFTAR